MTRRIALLMTVLALVVTACGTGVESAEVETLAAAAPAIADATPAPAGGDVEGIQVHGHWTIEVRNPDGSIDGRYEFENALTTNGAEVLVKLLADPASLAAPNWRIDVDNPFLFQSIQLAATPAMVDTDADGKFDALILSGSGTSTFDGGTIESVRTFLSSGFFTEKLLDAPISTAEGQDVEITVEISFS